MVAKCDAGIAASGLIHYATILDHVLCFEERNRSSICWFIPQMSVIFYMDQIEAKNSELKWVTGIQLIES